MFRSTLSFVYVSAAHPQPASVRLPGKDVKVELQFVHALAPVTFEYVPPGHNTHALALLAPRTVEYAPAEQLVHTVEEFAPSTPEYVPAVQLMHSVEAVAPTVLEYAPAGQFTHAVAPSTFEYAPAGQFTHALASGTKYLPTAQPTHEEVMHPLTCTSVRIK